MSLAFEETTPLDGMNSDRRRPGGKPDSHPPWRALLLAGLLCFSAQAPAWAAAPAKGGNAPAAAATSTDDRQALAEQWLARLQSAPQRHSYAGDVVVSVHGRVSTSRIEHARDVHGRTLDRIETLSGQPRITYRQADEVLTLWPRSQQAVREKRDPLLSFPNLLQGAAGRLARFYAIVPDGEDWVAGHAADQMDLQPLDAWRYSYKIWTEKKSGLPVKVQILDAQGRVLEQSMFAELTFDPALDAAAMLRQRNDLQAYKVKTSSLQRTTPEQEGWRMAQPVPGFEPVNCYRRLLDQSQGQAAMQWIFSDGLASVSLFLQPFDSARHQRELQLSQGATHVLTRRIQDWWLTAVGEVPMQTLQAFAEGLQRSP